MTAHDADQVLGRIRKDGGWDRRYRYAAATDDEPVAPDENVRGGCLALALWGVAFWLYFAILSASQVQP